MKRILVYSHDTLGLGSTRRMHDVARHLAAASPEVSVLLLTGSPMLHAFRAPQRVDHVKLPCLARDADGRLGACTLPLSLEETVRLRANLIRSAIADFAPDLILVDEKPFGVEDELAGALRTVCEGGSRPAMVLLLRDVLDEPEATQRAWRRNGYFDAIGAWYDAVLVMGSPQVCDLQDTYGFPPFAAARLRYCGHMAGGPAPDARATVRRTLGVSAGEPLLLVTPGSGEHGFELVRTALAALAGLPPAQRPRAHVVCGPRMAPELRAAARQAAHGLDGVSVQDACDHMMPLMDAADVVLSGAGYNTVCELLTLRKRALLVPRGGPGAEQRLRAERMAALGVVRMLYPELLGASTLAVALQAELTAWSAQIRPPALRPMDGLARLADALFELIDHRAAAPVAGPAPGWSLPQPHARRELQA